ncbi:MAG: transposase, partial [Saprospiraceae bacterium]
MTKIDTLAIPNNPKDRYKVTNWSAYNAGLKRRGSLTLWIDESISGSRYHQGPNKRGGQQIYSAECIVLLLTLKVTFCLAFRQ